MPIIIKNYNWHQTDKYITISVPLKGAHKKSVDLLTSSKYIKAHYNPYFFELFLLKPIDDTKSSCYITDIEIIFALFKCVEEQWEKAEAVVSKEEKIELKKKYLEEIQNVAEERCKKRSEERSELKRLAVREQIAIDTKFREELANVKKQEMEKALKEMNLMEEEPVEPVPMLQHSTVNTKNFGNKNPLRAIVASKHIKPQPILPIPRKQQSVNVSFTAREFPTPTRESREAEEQEWLRKQAEARRSVGFNDADLRTEERNPQWLKDKGDKFYKSKNYLAAISAYSMGIKLSKNFAGLYANRSAAHFVHGNLHRTIEDCSTALELMKPICQANLLPRARCLARRGAALAQVGMLEEGVGELEAALKLLPNDKALLEDYQKIKSQIK